MNDKVTYKCKKYFTFRKVSKVIKKSIFNFKYLLFIIGYSMILLISRIDLIKNINVSLTIRVSLYMILGVSSFIIYKDLYKEGIEEWKKSVTKTVIIILLMYILKTILTIVSSIPLEIFFPEYESVNSNSIVEAIQMFPAPIVLLALGILGPIVEEIVFRGILVGKFKEYIPSTICVIVSSILFMFIHIHVLSIQELLYCLSYFVGGMLYSILYLKTKNLTIPMILHIINNFFSLLLLIISIRY